MKHPTAAPHHVQVGLITAEPSATLLSVIRQAGIDFLVLDAEQTGLSVRECADAVQRLAGSGTEVAIRVPDLTEMTLVEFANTGAAELVLPKVRRVSELESAHRATRYVPEGIRSKQASYSSAFGRDFSHMPRLTVLFETVDAVDAVAEIAASDHFEGGWVGPADLAADLFAAGRTQPDALERATQEIVDTLRSFGRGVGLPVAGTHGIPAAIERGADRVAFYWERYLTTVVSDMVDATRNAAVAEEVAR